MIIVKNKRTGLVLGIDAVYTLQAQPERIVVHLHDVDRRRYVRDLADILKDYEFVKEVK